MYVCIYIYIHTNRPSCLSRVQAKRMRDRGKMIFRVTQVRA